MTYCLAMRLHEGLVFLADTRTNAGVDDVSNYRKLHVIRPAPDRVIVLESAGNLATTEEVLARIGLDLERGGDVESLATVGRLFEAALYVGRVAREVTERHKPALDAAGADGSATFILGGQIGEEAPDILLVYPEGNYIRASEERPFLQIGETKYGKFMLDVAVQADADLETATKIALSSMMSTARANLSVGPPYDGAIYRDDTFQLAQFRVEADSELLARLQEVWERHVLAAVAELPQASGSLEAARPQPELGPGTLAS